MSILLEIALVVPSIAIGWFSQNRYAKIKNKNKIAELIKLYLTADLPVKTYSNLFTGVDCPHCNYPLSWKGKIIEVCHCDNYPFAHFHMACKAEKGVSCCLGKYIMMTKTSSQQQDEEE
jgi:hypothetical protein